MRADLVVLASPLLDAHACLGTARKPVHVQALVAKLPVEALQGAVGAVSSGLEAPPSSTVDTLARGSSGRRLGRAGDLTIPCKTHGIPDPNNHLTASSCSGFITSDHAVSDLVVNIWSTSR